MADRFDRFTERARRVLTVAQEEAQRLGHNHIGTEHLLLALVSDDSVGCKVIVNLGAEPSKVRAAVEFIVSRDRPHRSGDIGLTPQAKKVIELAVEEARRLNHSYIGTEHLLLGLIREGRSIAFGVLESLGISLERARTETDRILAQGGAQGASGLGEAGPTQAPPASVVSPDAQARSEAQDRLRASIVELAGFTGSGLERGLIDGLLLPSLTSLLRDLFFRTASASELAETRQRIRDALRIVATASGVFEKNGHADMADRLSAVSVAVTRAVFTPPPQSTSP